MSELVSRDYYNYIFVIFVFIAANFALAVEKEDYFISLPRSGVDRGRPHVQLKNVSYRLGSRSHSSQSNILVFRAVNISPYKANGNCLC